MDVGQTVYADVLFLINFSMDFLVFYICARLAGRRLYPFRSTIAAALGGAYGVASLFVEENTWIVFLLDVFSLLLICAIAFASKGIGISNFFVRCALFALVSAILGGIMTALSSILERSGLAALDYESGDDISVWIFAMLAAAGGAAAFAGGKRMKRLAPSKCADVIITFKGKSVTLRAMTDTGNMLTDPLSGRSVAVCELDSVSDLLSRDMIEYWKSRKLDADIEKGFASRLRFIPAKGALGGRASLLSAIEPDSVKIINGKKIIDADILIAPVPYNLSAGESRVLLPPGFVE